ncbi:MAG TPA: DUF6356 family protein [Sphingomicrobium sp.]|nr:DUF6356 family protein [Sphingomicrobium sp.]
MPKLDRLFTEHPRSLGMSWAGHAVGAVAIGARLIGAGAACLIHAIVPGWFTETAGRTVTGMYDHMTKRRAGAANPNDWPEYEI